MSEEETNEAWGIAEPIEEIDDAEDGDDGGVVAAKPLRDPAALRLGGRKKGKRLVLSSANYGSKQLTAEQRLLILDTWHRSGLPAKGFAPLVGVSKHTLYDWKHILYSSKRP